jgi:hypothetical protein
LSARRFVLCAEANDNRSDIAVGVYVFDACWIVFGEQTANLVSRKVAGNVLDEDEVLVWRFSAMEQRHRIGAAAE